VALNLDFSNSTRPVETEVKNTAKAFLDQLKPTDEATVFKFAREVQQEIAFTQLSPEPPNLTLLKSAIDVFFPVSRTATRLYDAVSESVDSLALRSNERLAAVVLSDGNDNDSTTNRPISTNTLNDVIGNAQADSVFIFTIGLGPELNREVMQLMAVETGGQYFEAPSAADLAGIYTQISQILFNQYEITFATTRPAGSSNSLNVIATSGALNGEDTDSFVY
jgi:hypothetical protein